MVMDVQPLFRISYRFIGHTFSTVWSAPDADTAVSRFKRINDHVEFLSCEAANAPEVNHPPRCAHGPESCPKMTYRGFCNAPACIYGLQKIGEM